MLLLTQDKKAVVNLDRIQTIELDAKSDFKSIIIYRETNQEKTGICGMLLGYYTTKKRANEVFQEIIKYYKVKDFIGEIYEMPET